MCCLHLGPLLMAGVARLLMGHFPLGQAGPFWDLQSPRCGASAGRNESFPYLPGASQVAEPVTAKLGRVGPTLGGPCAPESYVGGGEGDTVKRISLCDSHAFCQMH